MSKKNSKKNSKNNSKKKSKKNVGFADNEYQCGLCQRVIKFEHNYIKHYESCKKQLLKSGGTNYTTESEQSDDSNESNDTHNDDKIKKLSQTVQTVLLNLKKIEKKEFEREERDKKKDEELEEAKKQIDELKKTISVLNNQMFENTTEQENKYDILESKVSKLNKLVNEFEDRPQPIPIINKLSGGHRRKKYNKYTITTDTQSDTETGSEIDIVNSYNNMYSKLKPIGIPEDVNYDPNIFTNININSGGAYESKENKLKKLYEDLNKIGYSNLDKRGEILSQINILNSLK